MNDMYSKVVMGLIAISLSILAIKNLDIIGSANAVVDYNPNPYGLVEKAPKPMIGEIKIFAGDYAPEGWAFCDGEELKIKDHEDLYTVIGDVYGGDDEEKTFLLPDLSGRAAIGVGSNKNIGDVELGDGRIFFSNIIRDPRPAVKKAELGKTKLNKNMSKELNMKTNNPTRTADLGLNYIICIEGIIPE